MERIVKGGYAELIGAGISLIPCRIYERISYAQFFTGTNPSYAGLFDNEKTEDGRSYYETWSVANPHHLLCEDKRTTMVMPNLCPQCPIKLLPYLVVHELGHVLHEVLQWQPSPAPVTDYAKTDWCEAFAEAFTLWLFPGYKEYYKILRPIDGVTLNLFNELN